MESFIVASTRPYIGKSGIVLSLMRIAQDGGARTAYFKPYGTMPATVDGVHTDLDAAFISRQATTDVALDTVCPVVESRTFIEEVSAGRIADERDRVREAFERVADDADLVVVEGPSDIFQGRSVELSLAQVADLLGARVLLVAAADRASLPDGILGAADCLGNRLAGVLFNAVQPHLAAFVEGEAAPFLTRRGMSVFGSVPFDAMLSSVTIAEVTEELGGTVLCAERSLALSAETFMVGAMGQDKALRFFRHRPRKIVVTGGDRSDVQLAALETDTRALVLTGDLPPSAHVLSRAEGLGVPIILVPLDTLSAVERLERLFGRVRLHDPVKADRIRAMLTASVDVDAMMKALVSQS